MRYLLAFVLLLLATPAAAQYRNALVVVQAVHQDYPGLIGKGIPICGEFVDQVAHRLNRQDGAVRWGRKARQSDGGNPNCDALAYLNDGTDRSRKTLVDIIINGPDPGVDSPSAAPAWQEFLGDNVGNGFWTEPKTPDRDGTGPTPPPPGSPPSGEHAALLELVSELQRTTAAQHEKIVALLGETPPPSPVSVPIPPPAGGWGLIDFLQSDSFKVLVSGLAGVISTLLAKQ